MAAKAVMVYSTKILETCTIMLAMNNGTPLYNLQICEDLYYNLI